MDAKKFTTDKNKNTTTHKILTSKALSPKDRVQSLVFLLDHTKTSAFRHFRGHFSGYTSQNLTNPQNPTSTTLLLHRPLLRLFSPNRKYWPTQNNYSKLYYLIGLYSTLEVLQFPYKVNGQIHSTAFQTLIESRSERSVISFIKVYSVNITQQHSWIINKCGC